MLTKEELLIQDTKPLIKDVSLKLYKDFCVDILFKKRFHYYFSDGTDIPEYDTHPNGQSYTNSHSTYYEPYIFIIDGKHYQYLFMCSYYLDENGNIIY